MPGETGSARNLSLTRQDRFDLIVVGAGIVGLAHGCTAAQLQKAPLPGTARRPT
jgi:cation diffusion facilitator CzcD-associated flavoprotein CzcO